MYYVALKLLSDQRILFSQTCRLFQKRCHHRHHVREPPLVHHETAFVIVDHGKNLIWKSKKPLFPMNAALNFNFLRRIPAGQVLRCRVERKDGVAPIYTLVNESSGATLMSAKRKLGLGVHFTVYQGNSVRAEVR